MQHRYYCLWGDEGKKFESNPLLFKEIYRELGAPESEIWDGYYSLQELNIDENLRSILRRCLPDERISFDTGERFYHSVGRGSMEYARLLENERIRIVDAVIYPREEEIECIFRELKDVAEIITYGGGTSVTGGIIPSGKRRYAVSLDTRNLDFFRVDERSMVLEAGAGIRGPDLEDMLEKKGLTLGNFPESFLYSTVGGWIATNAAGQESNRYGKIKDMLLGIKMVSPAGTFTDHVVPAESAFFRVSDIATGSEGAFGIITRAWLKLHKRPEKLYFRSYMYRGFSEGIEALRRLFTSGRSPMVSRLSDERETFLSLLAIRESLATGIFKLYLKSRGVLENGSLMIIVDDRNISLDGGVSLGSMPSRYWMKTRYDRPYMYNELLKHGIVAETIETSVTWGEVERLYSNVKKSFQDALNDLRINGTIMCHASHEYVSGTALYFTFLFYGENERERYLKILRRSVMNSILESGGSISHHHGIGTYLGDEFMKYKGKQYEMIRILKNYLDPDNMLNPGVLQ
ncbi:MAG: FAD-binding oxidoreductase [Thermoplasmata archaeon]